MERTTLPSTQVNTEALNIMTNNHADIVNEVITAVAKNKIVVSCCIALQTYDLHLC